MLSHVGPGRAAQNIGAALLFVAIFAGCQSMPVPFEPLNPDTGPGGGLMLDTLNPTKDAAVRSRNPYDGPSPSVVGVTRENWPSTTFLVPVSGVNHHTHYTDDKPRFARQTARARGEYPTQANVLETWSDDSSGSQALEALAAPVRAGWDIVRFPWRAVQKGKRPWNVTESPIRAEAYQRALGTDRHETITGTPVPTPTPPQAPSSEPKQE